MVMEQRIKLGVNWTSSMMCPLLNIHIQKILKFTSDPLQVQYYLLIYPYCDYRNLRKKKKPCIPEQLSFWPLVSSEFCLGCDRFKNCGISSWIRILTWSFSIWCRVHNFICQYCVLSRRLLDGLPYNFYHAIITLCLILLPLNWCMQVSMAVYF